MVEKKVSVKMNAENPEPVEIIVQSIIDISRGVKKIMAGRINKDALVLLITSACPPTKSGFNYRPMTKKQVSTVLDVIGDLEALYIKKVPEKK